MSFCGKCGQDENVHSPCCVGKRNVPVFLKLLTWYNHLCSADDPTLVTKQRRLLLIFKIFVKCMGTEELCATFNTPSNDLSTCGQIQSILDNIGSKTPAVMDMLISFRDDQTSVDRALSILKSYNISESDLERMQNLSTSDEDVLQTMTRIFNLIRQKQVASNTSWVKRIALGTLAVLLSVSIFSTFSTVEPSPISEFKPVSLRTAHASYTGPSVSSSVWQPKAALPSSEYYSEVPQPSSLLPQMLDVDDDDVCRMPVENLNDYAPLTGEIREIGSVELRRVKGISLTPKHEADLIRQVSDGYNTFSDNLNTRYKTMFSTLWRHNMQSIVFGSQEAMGFSDVDPVKTAWFVDAVSKSDSPIGVYSHELTHFLTGLNTPYTSWLKRLFENSIQAKWADYKKLHPVTPLKRMTQKALNIQFDTDQEMISLVNQGIGDPRFVAFLDQVYDMDDLANAYMTQLHLQVRLAIANANSVTYTPHYMQRLDEYFSIATEIIATQEDHRYEKMDAKWIETNDQNLWSILVDVFKNPQTKW